MPEIGLVGLGRMGVAICANLIRAGYSVQAGDRRPEAAEQAVRCGARWVPEMARLAAGADVLITVLPGPGEVRELMLGAGGAAAALRAGTTWGVLREALADSAADSRFIQHDLPALFAGDFMRTFGLDRCYEELQIVTELARDHHLPFQVSEAVADVYRRALQRYGPVDGELMGVALLEEQAGLQLRHPAAN